MKRILHVATVVAIALAVASTALAAASAGGRSSHRSADIQGGTATLAVGSFESLDPQVSFLQTDSEAQYVVYTPLLTFAHANGPAGSQLIPGLATALPKVSNGGTTYTLYLRKGLVYSNGEKAKASDFAYAVMRALKLNWGGDSFLTADIQGAADYLAGKASTVSGISTNDATGKITIRLVRGDSAFSDILAFTGLGLVPSSTPMKDMATAPPAGIGAYMIENVVPNQSFELVRNPRFAALRLPGIPAGHLDTIKVSVTSNPLAAGEAVLNNQIDAFDPAMVLSPALIAPIRSQAADRFRAEPTAGLHYIFFNTKVAPFDNKLARVAVTYAFDRGAAARLESGFLQVGCYVLPINFPGHPTKPCPYGKPSAPPDVAKAQSLVRQANLVGTPVTVWAQAADPWQGIAAYYVSVLNSIGFKASLKTISPAIYYPTTANPKLNIQTGLAAYGADYANPTTFYHLLDASSITPTFSVNRDQLDDPHVQAELGRLKALPLSAAVDAQWASLDYYVAQQAYWLVLGYPKDPEFFSNRIDITKAIFNQRYLDDLSSWQLRR